MEVQIAGLILGSLTALLQCGVLFKMGRLEEKIKNCHYCQRSEKGTDNLLLPGD